MKRDKKSLKEQYNERLKKIVSKKFDTTMIYPLSQFEAAFGHLWKHKVDKTKLTDEELMFRAKWEECRNNILNTGNQQKRNAMAEIDQYSVVWEGYKTIFLPADSQDNVEE